MIFGILFLIPAIASAEEILVTDSQLNANAKSKKPKFAIGIGIATVRFDTKIKITNKDTGNSVFLDPEGNLDLPEIATVNTFYLAFKPAKKHSFGFAYFAVKRENTLFDERFTFDDLVVISGKATLSDDTKFYFINYDYSLYRDDRSNVNALFGISGLDLEYTFLAEWELTIGDETRIGTYQNEASLFAPLPMFGLDIGFDITQKWSISTKLAFVYGEY